MVWKGFTYTIANSSEVTTHDVGVHAGGYMAVAEMDGGGRHVYRNLQVVPRNGRLIASNADGFHSADMDHAPIFERVHFKSIIFMHDHGGDVPEAALKWAREKQAEHDMQWKD